MDRRRRLPVAVLAASLFCLAVPTSASAQGAPIPMVSYNAHWGEQVDARTGRWTGKLDLAQYGGHPALRRRGGDAPGAPHLSRVRARRGERGARSREATRWTSGGVARHAYFHGSAPIAIWCKRKTGRRVVKWIYGRPGRCQQHGNAILSKRPLQSHPASSTCSDRRRGTSTVPARAVGRSSPAST